MPWLYSIVFFCVSALGDRFLPKDPDLVWVAFQYPPKIVSGIALERERLAGLCPGRQKACMKTHYRQGVWNLGELYSGPSKLKSKVGSLIGVSSIDETSGELVISVGFQPEGSSGTKNWISHVSKLDQKTYLILRAINGDWALLPTHPFPENTWINLSGSGIFGIAESALTELMQFSQPVLVYNYQTQKEEKLKTGVYYFAGMKKGDVIFRKELPSDMICGRRLTEVSAPKKEFYRVALSELFEPAGWPKFSLAYPNGCRSVFQSPDSGTD